MTAAAQHNYRSKVEELSASTDGVGVSHEHDIDMHRPGRLERLFAILSCRSRCSIGNSVHFHADHVEDVRISIMYCHCNDMISSISPHTGMTSLLIYVHIKHPECTRYDQT